MVYIWYHTNQTPSLSNVTVWTTSPWITLLVPITWNPAQTRPGYTLRYVYIYCICITADVMIDASTPLLHQYPSHWRVRYLKQSLSLELVVLYCPPFPPWFKSLFMTQLNSLFPSWFDSQFLTGLDSVFFDEIQLTFNVFIFDLSHIIWVTFHSIFKDSLIFQGVL